MYKSNPILVITLLVMLTATAAGQKNVQTPYARYGMGSLEQQGPFRTRAMGGISSGIRDNLTLNYLTPASYSSIDTTSFIFDFGIDYGYIRLKEDELKASTGDLNFSHLMLGFPVTRNWGVAVALLPYVNGAYDISYKYDGTGVSGPVYERHNGSGGYHRVVAGTGVNILSYLAVGLNLFYTYGEVTRINELVFTGDNNYFNTRGQSAIAMRGPGYEASLQVMIPLAGDRFINAGVTFTPSYKLKTGLDELTLRYANVQSSLSSTDTLRQNSSSTSSTMPQSLRAGFTAGSADKLTVGADILFTRWSSASLPGTHGTLADAVALHAGAEYIPDKYSNYSFFERVEYRIGGRYEESYTLFAGEKLKEYGITFGTGLPMRRTRSRISLTFDLSTRGNGSPLLPRETVVSIGASLNLYDYWFLKRQYD